MKPQQLGLMINPESGQVAIVLKKPRTTVLVRDVTNDFILMQVAEIMNTERSDVTGVSREYTVRDASGAVIVAEVTCRIISHVK
jgi:hypothetical protein